MKVTGWTWWGDPKYIDILNITMKERCNIIYDPGLPQFPSKEECAKMPLEELDEHIKERNEAIDEALEKWYNTSDFAKIEAQLDNVVIEELREHNYHFTGSDHQNYDYGCPIIDDKYIYCTDMRSWGDLIYQAFPNEDYSKYKEGMEYLKWAWTYPKNEEAILPYHDKFYKEKILVIDEFNNEFEGIEDVNMTTQIAPTPVVKGQAAKIIYNQANQKRTEASKQGAAKLMEKFSGKVKTKE